MKEFKVLPTDERFTSLTDAQITLILENMELDNKYAKLAAKGIDPTTLLEDTEDSWWNVSHDDFKAKEEDHNEEDIANQVEALTNKEDLELIKQRFKTTAEFDEFMAQGGALAKKIETETTMKANLERVLNEAKELNDAGITNWGKPSEVALEEALANEKLGELSDETIQEAVDLFSGELNLEDEDIIRPTQDDEFYI